MRFSEVFLSVIVLLAAVDCQHRGSKRYTPSPFVQREDLAFRPSPRSHIAPPVQSPPSSSSRSNSGRVDQGKGPRTSQQQQSSPTTTATIFSATTPRSAFSVQHQLATPTPTRPQKTSFSGRVSKQQGLVSGRRLADGQNKKTSSGENRRVQVKRRRKPAARGRGSTSTRLRGTNQREVGEKSPLLILPATGLAEVKPNAQMVTIHSRSRAGDSQQSVRSPTPQSTLPDSNTPSASRAALSTTNTDMERSATLNSKDTEGRSTGLFGSLAGGLPTALGVGFHPGLSSGRIVTIPRVLDNADILAARRALVRGKRPNDHAIDVTILSPGDRPQSSASNQRPFSFIVNNGIQPPTVQSSGPVDNRPGQPDINHTAHNKHNNNDKARQIDRSQPGNSQSRETFRSEQKVLNTPPVTSLAVIGRLQIEPKISRVRTQQSFDSDRNNLIRPSENDNFHGENLNKFGRGSFEFSATTDSTSKDKRFNFNTARPQNRLIRVSTEPPQVQSTFGVITSTSVPTFQIPPANSNTAKFKPTAPSFQATKERRKHRFSSENNQLPLTPHITTEPPEPIVTTSAGGFSGGGLFESGSAVGALNSLAAAPKFEFRGQSAVFPAPGSFHIIDGELVTSPTGDLVKDSTVFSQQFPAFPSKPINGPNQSQFVNVQIRLPKTSNLAAAPVSVSRNNITPGLERLPLRQSGQQPSNLVNSVAVRTTHNGNSPTRRLELKQQEPLRAPLSLFNGGRLQTQQESKQRTRPRTQTQTKTKNPNKSSAPFRPSKRIPSQANFDAPQDLFKSPDQSQRASPEFQFNPPQKDTPLTRLGLRRESSQNFPTKTQRAFPSELQKSRGRKPLQVFREPRQPSPTEAAPVISAVRERLSAPRRIGSIVTEPHSSSQALNTQKFAKFPAFKPPESSRAPVSLLNAPGFATNKPDFHEEVILSKPSFGPNYIPGFTCEGKPYGYYADEINSCRIFHICQPVDVSSQSSYYTRYSFACGDETIFDQSKLSCLHTREAMPCSSSAQWHFKNADFGTVPIQNSDAALPAKRSLS